MVLCCWTNDEIDSAWLIRLFVKLLNPQLIRTIEWAFWPPLSALESVNVKNTQIPDWISISKILYIGCSHTANIPWKLAKGFVAKQSFIGDDDCSCVGGISVAPLPPLTECWYVLLVWLAAMVSLLWSCEGWRLPVHGYNLTIDSICIHVHGFHSIECLHLVLQTHLHACT